MSDPVDIGGALNNPYVETEHVYNYGTAPSTCPACGGVGSTWSGLFTCENPACGLVALVGDGRCFRPVVLAGTP